MLYRINQIWAPINQCLSHIDCYCAFQSLVLPVILRDSPQYIIIQPAASLNFVNHFTIINWKRFCLFHIPSSSYMQYFSLLASLSVCTLFCCRATWSDYKRTPVLLLLRTSTQSSCQICLSYCMWLSDLFHFIVS